LSEMDADPQAHCAIRVIASAVFGDWLRLSPTDEAKIVLSPC
jgi:hypothetical protein